MKKLTARQIEALGIVAANQPLPLYDPEGPIDFKRAFAGHMAATATSLIDRGLVEVIEHREWILTAAGVEAAQAAGFEAKPAAGGERYTANQYWDDATRSYVTQILDVEAGGSVDLEVLAGWMRGQTAAYDGNRTAAAESLAECKKAAASLNAQWRAEEEDRAAAPGPEAFLEPGYGYDPEKAERLLAAQATKEPFGSLGPQAGLDAAMRGLARSIDDRCECGHYADQHSDEQPHECLHAGAFRGTRCACPSFKAA